MAALIMLFRSTLIRGTASLVNIDQYMFFFTAENNDDHCCFVREVRGEGTRLGGSVIGSVGGGGCREGICAVL